jgi:pimeloyl-ACP methyl ester carboxylesterase
MRPRYTRFGGCSAVVRDRMAGDGKMEMAFYLICGLTLGFLAVSWWLTYLVHRLPRRPVNDPPDWGTVEELKIPAADGGFLEAWRVTPRNTTGQVVVLAHGWGRNRDRMVPRARMFGRWGYITVIHSARDHGGSSPCRWMNGFRFGEDIESVLRWIDRPAIVYGHSAGAAGALMAAHRNPGRVRALFLESCYDEVLSSLRSLYAEMIPFVGRFFGPLIVFWLDRVLYPRRLRSHSPSRLAAGITVPVMLIQGENDPIFPPAETARLIRRFPSTRTRLWVAPGADHSSPSAAPGYAEAVGGFLDREVTPR